MQMYETKLAIVPPYGYIITYTFPLFLSVFSSPFFVLVEWRVFVQVAESQLDCTDSTDDSTVA